MTRKQHLQKLPLQKRLQAMENIRRGQSFSLQERINDECFTKENVLCFIYDETRQGHSYLWNIRAKYFVVGI